MFQAFKARIKNMDRRLILYPACYGYVAVSYLTTNHYLFMPAKFLPRTFIDVNTPFLPWTVWIYSSVYFMPLFAAVYVTKKEHYNRIAVSYVLTATICTLFFLFYPTIYPRPQIGENSITGILLRILHFIDTPANCWPSGHVAYAFLSAFWVARFRRKEGAWLIFWAFLIAISTLTTKQHYIWDVLAGYFLARLSFKLCLPKDDKVLAG